MSDNTCSRYIVNWDLRESMTEADIEMILERGKELQGRVHPAGNAVVPERCLAFG
jgi:hypothetical protein